MSNLDLMIKTYKVLSSSTTPEQYKVAVRYAQLAEKHIQQGNTK